MTEFIDMIKLKKDFKDEKNIMQILKQQNNILKNNYSIIETSYDLQAGTYIKKFQDNPSLTKKIVREQALLINKYFPDAKTIIDCGCGELTNSCFLFSNLQKFTNFLCFDISWSRLYVGRNFLRTYTTKSIIPKMSLFVSNMNEIPLSSESVDLVTTTHALEPNHGNEKELLKEIMRISKKGAILFEPSFESGSKQQKERMIKFGYIRNMPEIIRNELGYDLIEIELNNFSNPLNRTNAYIIKKHSTKENNIEFVDPVSKTKLKKKDSFYFSPVRGVSFPIIQNIPVLKNSNEILTTQWD